MPVRVLIADDAPEFRFLVDAWFGQEDDLELVEAVPTGRLAVQASAQHRPDVLVLDYRLPDVREPGDLVAEIRREAPETRVLVYCGMPAEALEREHERLGADVVMSKRRGIGELCAAIRELATAA